MAQVHNIMHKSTPYHAEDIVKSAQMPVLMAADNDGGSTRDFRRAYCTNDTDFIAHLIAHKHGYAQTRQKRRTSNVAAQTAYQATLASADKRMPVGYSKNIAA